jgi:cyclomaltodextrinase / maltogenic alpha-amylase / neopullulanase
MMTLVLLLGPIACAAQPAQDLSSLTARPAPEWLTRGVMYQIWLRSFTPEGTLKAAARRLPAVAELGATVIYLSPINLSDEDMRREFWSTRQKASGTNNPRNPYRIKDYNRVDPEYGSADDLREFMAAAHKLNLHVLMDMVFFHCGPTALLMEHPEYFKKDKAGKVSTGSWNFPVLNFENQQLREHLWANMEMWVKDFGADGFRCDVADAVPLDFWEEARTRIEKYKPDLVILAEGQRRTDSIKAFDIDYGFSWYHAATAIFTKSEPASSLRKLWEKQQAERPRGARILRFTENHDIVNDMCRADALFSEQGAMAMAVVNFTIDGVPMIYSGQEIGDLTPQSIYAKWAIRWEAGCLPKAQARLEFYKKLCQLRRSTAALTSGAVVWLDNDPPDAVVSFLRRSQGEEILSVVNLTNRLAKVRIQLPDAAKRKYENLLPGKDAPKWSDDAVLNLRGYGYFVGKRQP